MNRRFWSAEAALPHFAERLFCCNDTQSDHRHPHDEQAAPHLSSLHPDRQPLRPPTAKNVPNAPCAPQTDAPWHATAQATSRLNQDLAPSASSQSTGSRYLPQTRPCAMNAACPATALRVSTRRVVANAWGNGGDGHLLHLQVLQQRHPSLQQSMVVYQRARGKCAAPLSYPVGEGTGDDRQVPHLPLLCRQHSVTTAQESGTRLSLWGRE